MGGGGGNKKGGGAKRGPSAKETQSNAIASAASQVSASAKVHLFPRNAHLPNFLLREKNEHTNKKWWKDAAQAVGDVGTMVYLVRKDSSAWKSVLDLLARVPNLRLKESESLCEGATLVFPSVGQALVLLGRDGTSNNNNNNNVLQKRQEQSAWQKLEVEMQRFLTARRAPTEAMERVQSVASNFAHVSVLVVGDLDLAKYLYLEASRWPNVQIIACGSVAEASEQVTRLAQAQSLTKKTLQQQLRDVHKNGRTNTLSAPSVTAAIWEEVGIADAHERHLNSSDLFELLSGRASQAICEEQYGLNAVQARSVLGGLHKNTDTEM